MDMNTFIETYSKLHDNSILYLRQSLENVCLSSEKALEFGESVVNFAQTDTIETVKLFTAQIDSEKCRLGKYFVIYITRISLTKYYLGRRSCFGIVY